MTTYGIEAPDQTDGDLTIAPLNAAEIGYDVPAPADTKTGDSLLDELLGLSEEEISNVVFFPVNSRKGGFVLGFDAVIGEPAMKRYRKAAQGGRKRVEDSETTIGNAMAMIETNIGIYKVVDGVRKQIMDADGDPLLLNSEAFLKTYGPRQNAHAAVRKFLGDAETNTIGGAVLKAAGWGEDLEPLDPTDA
ncbi:tail assembly chaperone [Arthrobacter phage Hirko]|nr:tail assembly chaperone [Arthrobacter phage Hirko]